MSPCQVVAGHWPTLVQHERVGTHNILRLSDVAPFFLCQIASGAKAVAISKEMKPSFRQYVAATPVPKEEPSSMSLQRRVTPRVVGKIISCTLALTPLYVCLSVCLRVLAPM